MSLQKHQEKYFQADSCNPPQMVKEELVDSIFRLKKNYDNETKYINELHSYPPGLINYNLENFRKKKRFAIVRLWINYTKSMTVIY